MHKVRAAILHIFLIFLVFVGIQCQDPSGTGMGAAGGCSPTGGLNQATTVDTGETDIGYEGPVAIPVTIAKAMDGVDATTIYFQQAGASQQISKSVDGVKTALRAEAGVEGTVFFNTVDPSCPLVGVVLNDEFVNFVSPDPANGCLGSFEVSTINQPYALVALTGNSTDPGEASEPVIVQVTPTDGEAHMPELATQVIVTNLSQDIGDADHFANVEESSPSFITLDDLEHVFYATEQNPLTGSYDIWVTPDIGGAPEIFAATEVVAPGFTSASDNTVWWNYLNNGTTQYVGEDAIVHQIELAGIYTSESFTIDSDDAGYVGKSIVVSPTSRYVAYTVQALNPEGNLSFAIKLFDRDTSTTTGPFFEEGQTNEFDRFEMTWLDPANLLVIAETEDGTNQIFTFDPFDSDYDAQNDVYYVVYNIIKESAQYLGSPTSDLGQRGNIFYRCEEGGIKNLCVYNTNTGIEETLVDIGVDVRHEIKLSSDLLTYASFEVETVPVVKVCYYSFELETFSCPHYGIKSAASPTVPTIFTYIYAINGTQQVGINNLLLDPVSTPTDLWTAPTATLASNHALPLTATGGSQPYTWSLTSGDGSIVEATGRFTAPSDANEALVTVTDSVGDTAQVTITTPAPGSSDDTFGTAGHATLTDPDAEGKDLALTNDNKIVVVGQRRPENQLIVSQFTADGEVDTTFGTNGSTSVQVASGIDSAAYGVAIQTDGKIVACGKTRVAGDYDMAFVRFNADGSLDTSFGTNGVVTKDLTATNTDICNDVYVYSDGKILGVGYITTNSGSGPERSIALVRFNSDGSADTNFGDSGQKVQNISAGRNDWLESVAVQNDGKIVVVGTANSAATGDDFMVLRYKADGNLDFDFGILGKVIEPVSVAGDGAYDVNVNLSYITVVGAARNASTGLNEIGVMHLDKATGDLDTDFGDGGIVTLAGPSGESMAAAALVTQSDKRMLIAGSMGDVPNTEQLIVRIEENGDLDTNFGDNGYVTLTEGTTSEVINAIGLLNETKLVTAGTTQAGANISVRVLWQ